MAEYSRNNLISRIRLLEQEIQKLLRRIPQDLAADTSLFTRRSQDGSYRYFKRIRLPDGSSREIYLGKQKIGEARQIAGKMLTERILQDLIREKRLLEQLLAFRNKTPAAETFLKRHPGISTLLTNGGNSVASPAGLSAQPGASWKKAAYPRNQKHPEQLKYSTLIPGLLVRSKAEADIAGRLEYYGVPYHYDEMLEIGGRQFAMDFVCLNVSSNRLWYWDHRGMLDNPEYIRKTIYCETAFLNAGMIPWINMIVTAETLDHPLDLQWVDTIIQYYLL